MYCLLLWKIYTPLLPGFWRLGIITSASILVYSQAFMVPSVNVISTQHLLHLAPYRHTPPPCFTVFFSPLATIHRGPSHCLSCHKKLRFPLITPVPSLKHLPVCFPVLYCGIILGGHSVVLIIETIAHPVPPDYSYVFICAFW